jgi:hypothetical protein
MARTVRIQIRQLKELQAAMKAGSTSIEPAQVRPILAAALDLIRNQAYVNLKSVTSSTANLPPGWEHIEQVLVVQEGKSNRIARAFCKVFRKKAPQAIWIEWGHKIIGHKPNKTDLGKVFQPRPFFRPAIMAKRAAARKAIRVGLQQLLAKGFGFGKPGTADD